MHSYHPTLTLLVILSQTTFIINCISSSGTFTSLSFFFTFHTRFDRFTPIKEFIFLLFLLLPLLLRSRFCIQWHLIDWWILSFNFLIRAILVRSITLDETFFSINWLPAEHNWQLLMIKLSFEMNFCLNIDSLGSDWYSLYSSMSDVHDDATESL